MSCVYSLVLLSDMPVDLRKLRTLEFFDISNNQIASINKVFSTVLAQLKVC